MSDNQPPDVEEFETSCPRCGDEVFVLGTKFEANGECPRCEHTFTYSPAERAEDERLERRFEVDRDRRFDV